MAEIYEWADSAAGNGLGNPPDWPKEHMDKSDVNDSAREMMAALRSWYQAPQWLQLFDSTDESWTISRVSDTVVRVAGPSDASAAFPADRRLKITASSGPTTVYGYVHPTTGPAYGSPNTDVTVVIDAAGVVPVGTDTIEVFITELKTAAYRNVGSAAAEVPDGDALTASITANVSGKSAALKDYADSFGEADKVPLYDQLGTVGQYDQGTDPGEVPLVQDLPSVLGDLAVVDKSEIGLTRYQLATEFHYGPYSTDPPEMVIPALTNLPFPNADGTKHYLVTFELWFYVSPSLGGVSFGALRFGPLGTISDPQIINESAGSPPSYPAIGVWDVYGWPYTPNDYAAHARFRFHKPSSADRITATFDPDVGIGTDDVWVLRGSYVEFQEIWGGSV